MKCGICATTFTSRRRATCASCAQAALHEPRFGQAAALLEREKSHTHVEAILRPGNDGILAALPEDADLDAITAGIKSNGYDSASAAKRTAELQIAGITDKADQLRKQMDGYKNYISKQKDTQQRRKKTLAEQRKLWETYRSKANEPVLTAIKKTRSRLDKVHSRTAEAREFLCKEVSSLCGIQKIKNESDKTEYRLNGIAVPDPRDLNAMSDRIKIGHVETSSGTKPLVEPHEVISASLDNICRLLGICCHYLSIRLPAEIVLPHNDFPHSVILPERASYKSNSLRYPGVLSSRNASPSASRYQDNEPAKLRLLQLDRPLPQLHNQDAKTYGLFVEGVMLLAWDIAWLCRTQGLDTVNTFDDVCAIGKNLYQLLPPKDSRSRARPAISRNSSSATAISRKEGQATPPRPYANPPFGTFSHGSGRHALSGFEGLQLRESWTLSSFSSAQLVDKLRSFFRNETQRAEWHIVDDKEWDDETEDEKPVLVGGMKRSPLESKGKRPVPGPSTVASQDGAEDTKLSTEATKKKNGWMKVRGRGVET